MNIFITSLVIFSLFTQGLSLSGDLNSNAGKDPGPTTTVVPTTESPTTVPSTTSTSTTTESPTTSTSTTTESPTTNTSATTESSTTSTSTTTEPPTTTTASNTTGGPSTPSPTADVAMNVTWSFDSVANVTSVRMTIKNLQLKEWAAVGLNQETEMGGAHVFICRRLGDDSIDVGRYINPYRHEPPQAAGSEEGGTFIPGKHMSVDGAVICQFTLSNFTSSGTPAIPPLDQSGKYHPIFAVGMLDDDNEPKRHAKDSRTAQSALVQLNEDTVVLYKIEAPASDNSEKYLQAHGAIMVFAWILLASTGALISRYFKLTWAKRIICGELAWFAAHRFLMSLVAILTVLGFLFILVLTEGSWVDQGPTRAFAHSIVGVLAICLAFFQPFIALFRCDHSSRYRFVFNYIHAIVGLLSFVLANAALFLATYFHLFQSTAPRVVLVVWFVWIVLIVLAFELLQHRMRKKYQVISYTNINVSNDTVGEVTAMPTAPKATSIKIADEERTPSEDKIKNILLAVHVLLATILSIVLTNHIING